MFIHLFMVICLIIVYPILYFYLIDCLFIYLVFIYLAINSSIFYVSAIAIQRLPFRTYGNQISFINSQ